MKSITSTRNRAQTTERILTAFEQTVAQQGLEGLSITRLAEKANVSKVLIHRYFGNLEGLLEYYLSIGRVIPKLDSVCVESVRPSQEKDLANTWSSHVLQLFNSVRTKPAFGALLKEAVKENNSLATVANKALDTELTRLVNQLAFVEGSDHEAISAVVLGGLSYLTILTQLDRTAIGLNLRNEEDWQRVEKAIKLIYSALAKMATESPVVHLTKPSDNLTFQ